MCYILSTIISKLLKECITGTKLRKKVRNTKIIKSTQQFLLSEKPINWMRFLLPLFQKTDEMTRQVKIS